MAGCLHVSQYVFACILLGNKESALVLLVLCGIMHCLGLLGGVWPLLPVGRTAANLGGGYTRVEVRVVAP
jgi:hypothetical protein